MNELRKWIFFAWLIFALFFHHLSDLSSISKPLFSNGILKANKSLTAHSNGFSPVWIFWWLVNVLSCRNNLWHCRINKKNKLASYLATTTLPIYLQMYMKTVSLLYGFSHDSSTCSTVEISCHISDIWMASLLKWRPKKTRRINIKWFLV